MHNKLKAVVVSACILAKSESSDTDPFPRTTPRSQQQPRRQWWIKPVPLKMIVVGFDWQLGYKQMQFIRHCISWKHVYIYSDNLQTKLNIHQHTQHIIPLTNHHIIILVPFYVAISNMHLLPTIFMVTAVPPPVAPHVVFMPTHDATSDEKAITTTIVCSQRENILRHHE